jgi:hypothetical protein
MPFTKPDMLHAVIAWVGWALSALDRRLTEWAGRLAVPVLLAALLTGEALPWLDGSSQLISPPVIRSAHVVSGLLVLLLALGQVGSMALRAVRHVVRHRSVHPGTALALLRAESPAQRLLNATYGVVLVLVLVSGLARLALWGIAPPFLEDPAPFWMVMHRAAPPYLYALLLFLFVIRGRIFYKRTLAYLQSP